MIIVGAGILGLAVAEWESRATCAESARRIVVIDDGRRGSGSAASSGFLGRKGQLSSRTLLGQLKIDGQRQFGVWVESLHTEARCGKLAGTQKACERPWRSIFRSGTGLDTFESETDRDVHFARVTRSQSGMAGHAPHEIRRVGLTHIVYENEAWVDAQAFTELLKAVLRERGVSFISARFPECEVPRQARERGLVLAAGAWTPVLLEQLQLRLPESLARKHCKYTAGTAFCVSPAAACSGLEFLNEHALVDVHSSGFGTKHSLGGNFGGPAWVGAANARASAPDADLETNLSDSEREFLETTKLSAEKALPVRGMRLRFGNADLALARLEAQFWDLPVVVCAGAHKSGFSLAPMVGERVQSLLGGEPAIAHKL